MDPSQTQVRKRETRKRDATANEKKRKVTPGKETLQTLLPSGTGTLTRVDKAGTRLSLTATDDNATNRTDKAVLIGRPKLLPGEHHPVVEINEQAHCSKTRRTMS